MAVYDDAVSATMAVAAVAVVGEAPLVVALEALVLPRSEPPHAARLPMVAHTVARRSAVVEIIVLVLTGFPTAVNAVSVLCAVPTNCRTSATCRKTVTDIDSKSRLASATIVHKRPQK